MSLQKQSLSNFVYFLDWFTLLSIEVLCWDAAVFCTASLYFLYGKKKNIYIYIYIYVYSMYVGMHECMYVFMHVSRHLYM